MKGIINWDKQRASRGLWYRWHRADVSRLLQTFFLSSAMFWRLIITWYIWAHKPVRLVWRADKRSWKSDCGCVSTDRSLRQRAEGYIGGAGVVAHCLYKRERRRSRQRIYSFALGRHRRYTQFYHQNQTKQKEKCRLSAPPIHTDRFSSAGNFFARRKLFSWNGAHCAWLHNLRQ